MTTHLGGVADRVALSAARSVTRRRLLRNAGAGALGLTLGAALAGTREARVAFAHGSAGSPCGPSPIAPAGSCPSGNCNPPAECFGRYYNTFTCDGQFNGGCWSEDYRGTGQGLWNCCDICLNSGSGTACSGSCGTYGHRAAICRTRVG
jgi:hypothetical protein